jgi:hypothetical protein
MKYTVRLSDDTVGTISSDTLAGQSAECFIGEIVRIKHHDENGNPLESEGKLVEVLESSEDWQ